MGFYKTSYLETLALPLHVFWSLSTNVGRIQADNDIRELSLIVSVQQGHEAVNDKRQQLLDEMGSVARQEPVFDRIGLAQLKASLAK